MSKKLLDLYSKYLKEVAKHTNKAGAKDETFIQAPGGYSDGGNVEEDDSDSSENSDQSNSQDTSSPYEILLKNLQGLSKGGIVDNLIPEGNIKHYDGSDGSVVQPDPLEAKKNQVRENLKNAGIPDDKIEMMVERSFKSSQMPQGSADSRPMPQHMTPMNQQPIDLGEAVQGQNILNAKYKGGEIQNYEEGGEVQSDEEVAQELKDEQEKEAAKNLTDSTGYAEEDKNAEDMALGPDEAESEDNSDEESPENDLSAQMASENNKDIDSRRLEGMTLDKKEAMAENPSDPASGLQVNPAMQNLINASSQQKNGLAEAQKARANNIQGNQFLQGIMLAGSGLSRTDPSQALGLIKDREKYANLPVQNYEEQVANQKNDPNSPMSQALKGYFKSKNVNVPDNASAADILAFAPFVAKDQAAQMAMQKAMMGINARAEQGDLNRKSREKVASENQNIQKDRTAAMRERNKAMQGGAMDRKMLGLHQTLQKDLISGGGPIINQNRQDFLRASKIFIDAGVDPKIKAEEINKIPDQKLNKLNKLQVVEAALGVNKYFQGQGVPAQSTLDKLIPHNMNMSSTQIHDYISNNLNPADQASAMRAYLSIAARGRDYAKKNVENYMKPRISSSSNVLSYFPEQSKSLTEELTNQGFDLAPTKGNKESKGAMGMHQPGDIVNVKGKNYKVGADGDSLEEIQ